MNFVDAVKICFMKYADFNGCWYVSKDSTSDSATLAATEH